LRNLLCFRKHALWILAGLIFFPGNLSLAEEKAPVVFDAHPAAVSFPGASPAAGAGVTPNEHNQIIKPESLIVSKKAGYLFMVWDVFPLRARFEPGDKTRDTAALRYAAYLAMAYGFAKNPGFSEARVNLIAFKARDEYGGPRWDQAEKWHLYTFRADRLKSLGLTNPESLWTLDEKKLHLLPMPAPTQK
jgi:hypothetical protein